MEYIIPGNTRDKMWIDKQTSDLIKRELMFEDDGFYKCQFESQYTVIRLQVKRMLHHIYANVVDEVWRWCLHLINEQESIWKIFT